MARKTSVSATSAGEISPPQRESMIREAAYFRYMQRGSVFGHDLDDWFEAEAELVGQEAAQQKAEEFEMTELDVQESGTHGAWEDDALKRIIRQHPRKGIPQVESMEPREAPPKE